MGGGQIEAPFDGRLTTVMCDPSQLAPGQPVLILHDQQKLKVTAKAWQSQLQNIEPGNRVKVFPNFYKPDFFWGIVRTIRPAEQVADTRYPVFPIIIDLKGSPKHLRPGMAVSVQILGSRVKQ